MRARRILLRSAIALGLGVSALAACSLGLDGSKLQILSEAGTNANDTGAADVAQLPPDIHECRNDTDCASDGGPGRGCLTGRCIKSRCVYELCPSTVACSHKACINNTCGPDTKHFFLASRMLLGHSGLGCGDNLRDCVDVVYPYAFVGHKTGAHPVGYPIVDFNAPDGGESLPQPVTLQGADFIINRTVASGRKIWFIGKAAQTGADTTAPIAWIDVPPDPSLKTLQAKTVNVIIANGELGEVYPGDNEGIIVFRKAVGNEPRLAAQINVDPKTNTIPDKPQFAQLGDAITAAPVVTSSGDRLVTARSQQSPGPAGAIYPMNLIARAGTPSAAALGEQDLALTIQQIFAGATFGETPSGGVVVQAATGLVDDGGIVRLSTIQVAWVIQTKDDPNRAAIPNVELFRFDPDGGPDAPDPELIGPIAAAGDDRVLALQGGPDASSMLRGVVRTGQTGQADPASVIALPFPHSALALRGAQSESTSKSYGYVFTRPTNEADGIHVGVFELGCGNP